MIRGIGFWQMKKGRLLGSILIATFCIFSACSNTTSRQIEEETLEVDADTISQLEVFYAPYAHRIDSFFSREHQKTVFYGNVLFADSGRVVFERSYGYRKRRTDEAVTLDHSFQLASASKTFTSIAILMCIERGLLSLTDSLETFFPNAPYEGRMIHDMLSHRSGIPRYSYFCDNPDSIWCNKDSTIHNYEAIRIMEDIKPPVAAARNRRFYYSNTNFMILASIVEKVTGKPFREFLQENIFDPCGMNSTVLYERDNKDSLKLPVVGYESNFSVALDIYLNGCVGDKGIYSTVRDMLKFDQALYGDKLVSQELLQKAFTGHSKPDGGSLNKNYGYGFRMLDLKDVGHVVYHNGWWRGFRSYFIRIPNTQQTIIILSNVKRGPFYKLEDLIGYLPKY